MKMNILNEVWTEGNWDKRWTMKSIMKQSYDKNDYTRQSPEKLRGVLKMMCDKSYVDTSKGAAILRNNICDSFW